MWAISDNQIVFLWPITVHKFRFTEFKNSCDMRTLPSSQMSNYNKSSYISYYSLWFCHWTSRIKSASWYFDKIKWDFLVECLVALKSNLIMAVANGRVFTMQRWFSVLRMLWSLAPKWRQWILHTKPGFLQIIQRSCKNNFSDVLNIC